MQLGYYWAHHTKRNTWGIVEVVRGLHGAVLEGGYSVPVSEFDEFQGPLSTPPSDQSAMFDGRIF